MCVNYSQITLPEKYTLVQYATVEHSANYVILKG